ncbi:HD domain-containing protein [Variovorax paradoxus]|uniref:HD domain-containing protein n=1 Tax=Variovorax paradoxus TaxID=34073 RepID=UPI001933F008|nr:bifunctional (p)ppGpp synthetase/guanosine-3',5'-bis(diphosphate) 3'-pyrophosphohydrolase [Variovorax paradoxus]
MTPETSPDAARSYAIQMHGDQKYGVHPYVHHLDAVVALLRPYGEQAQVVGYLHDVVEDTDATVADIAERFGTLVAGCVALLSDAPGANRKERKARTYAAMSHVKGEQELALTVKAADRLANVRACVADGHRDLWETYRGEHATFKAAAYRAGQCDPLWAELDTLLSDAAAPERRPTA